MMNDVMYFVRHKLRQFAWKVWYLPNRLRWRWDFVRRGVHVSRGSFVDPKVRIGNRTRINAPSHLGSCTIGAYCAIGGRLVVRSGNHNMGHLNLQDFAQRTAIGVDTSVIGVKSDDVQIGNAVWIGDSVIVLPGVTVGDGAVIGAGSIVTRSIPPYAIAVGNPARVIRMRFSEPVIKELSNLKWWSWSDERLRNTRWLFEIDLTKLSDEEILLHLKDARS